MRHSDTVKQALQLGFHCQSPKECFVSHSEYRVFGPRNSLLSGFSVTSLGGEISPAPGSVSLGKIDLAMSLPPTDRADGISHLCRSSGAAENKGFPMLGVLIASGRTTSSELHGGGFPRMSPGSLSFERPEVFTTGVPLGTVLMRKTVATDASLTGWGALLEGRSVNRTWHRRFRHVHVNDLELLAVLMVLRHFLPFLGNCHVLVRTDKTTAVAYINR